MEDPLPVVNDVVRQHVENAAFLWAQRDTLTAEDLPDIGAIASVDGRLEANLDALRIAGAGAWPLIIDAFETYPEKGEVFVTAVRAIETTDARRVAQAVNFARVAEEGARGLCGAFEWLPPEATRGLVREWVHSPDPIKCAAAIAALTAHGADPRGLLTGFLKHGDEKVRAAACRLAATLQRQDAVTPLRQALDDPAAVVREGAALALAQLGHRDGEEILKSRVAARDEGWEKTLRALVAALPDAEIRQWLSGLNGKPESQIIAVRAAGMLGDRSLVPWIVRQMREPALAEAADRSLCELRPEFAGMDEVRSVDPEVLGPAFAAYFVDDIPLLPVADRVKAALVE